MATELQTFDRDGGPLEVADPLDALTDKEQRFVYAYVGEAHWNATRAAAIADYGDTYESRRTLGCRLLTKVHIQDAIRHLVETHAITALEWLHRLRDDVRFDHAQLARCYAKDPDGRRVVDWAKVRKMGLGPLIRRVVDTKFGERIEPIDVQTAKEQVGRALGLFADRLRVEGQIDYSKLTDDELKQLAAGKRPSTL